MQIQGVVFLFAFPEMKKYQKDGSRQLMREVPLANTRGGITLARAYVVTVDFLPKQSLCNKVSVSSE